MDTSDSYTFNYNSPVGIINITSDHQFITSITFKNSNQPTTTSNFVIDNCIQQLDEYFSGKRIQYDLPIKLKGTEFQKNVWLQLLKIPFGTTISYLKLAQQLGDEKKIRAVGTANGSNNFCVVIPCHRVIGSDGSLTGFAGGLWRKKWLLAHENKYAYGVATLF